MQSYRSPPFLTTESDPVCGLQLVNIVTSGSYDSSWEKAAWSKLMTTMLREGATTLTVEKRDESHFPSYYRALPPQWCSGLVGHWQVKVLLKEGRADVKLGLARVNCHIGCSDVRSRFGWQKVHILNLQLDMRVSAVVWASLKFGA